ncbi:MAG: glutamine amidotransferase [Hyphomicrobiales bacterium]
MSVPVFPSAPGKVLLIVHQETSTPGRVGVKLRKRGYALDVRRPCLGHTLPEDLSEYAGVVVFGGPMSANDCTQLDFIRYEIDWIGRPLDQNVPYLGICLGAQLLARHLGAKVSPHPEGRAEIGYYAVRPTPKGAELGPWPEKVYHWHREGFDLPAGAELLAEGDDFRNQAMRYGDTAFGLQFHPEVTLAMVHRWTARAAHRFSLPGAQDRDAHLEGRLIHDHAVEQWLDRFLDHWLASRSRADVADCNCTLQRESG